MTNNIEKIAAQGTDPSGYGFFHVHEGQQYKIIMPDAASYKGNDLPQNATLHIIRMDNGHRGRLKLNEDNGQLSFSKVKFSNGHVLLTDDVIAACQSAISNKAAAEFARLWDVACPPDQRSAIPETERHEKFHSALSDRLRKPLRYRRSNGFQNGHH